MRPRLRKELPKSRLEVQGIGIREQDPERCGCSKDRPTLPPTSWGLQENKSSHGLHRRKKASNRHRSFGKFHSLFSAYPVGFFLGRERLKSGWIQYRTNERRDTLRRESKALDNKHQGHFRRNTTSICPISPIAHVSLSVRHGLVCHIYM